MKNEDFGKMIYKLRTKCDLTQKELAERLHVGDKAVSKWENGLGYPNITQLPAIADLFGVSIDYLLKGNPRGIAIAGNIIVDILNTIDKYPDKTMLANISEIDRAVGGCVSNTIIDLAKIDPDLALTAIGKVGNDEYGKFVTSRIKKHGVDVSKVVISDNHPTSFCNVMTEKETGERTFFSAGGASATFDIDDIDIDNLDCEIFHIGYVCLLDKLDERDDKYGTRMAKLLCELQKRGIKTSIDAISTETKGYADTVIPALKYCNYAIMNEIESAMVTGLPPRYDDGKLNVDNIRKTMQKLIDYGVKEKVVIHCTEAGFMMTSEGEFTVVPSLKLPKGYIKGSVGAGDAFAAGCLYGIYNGYDNEKILRFASCAAVASLSETDSISGMKHRDELEKLDALYERGTL